MDFYMLMGSNSIGRHGSPGNGGDRMQGLFTVDSVDPNIVYPAIESQDDHDGSLHCYSRLPMRQLLRYVPTNRGSLWWLSELEAENAVPPDAVEVLEHLRHHPPLGGDIVVIDALHWMVQNNGEKVVLDALQQLDSYSRKMNFAVVFPVEPLAFEHRLWARIRLLAPLWPNIPSPEVSIGHFNEISNDTSSGVKEKEQLGIVVVAGEETAEQEPQSPSIVHLVSLPRKGFSVGLLQKRMLQWKRMGFDLSELEPALASENLDKAHSLYARMEQQITDAIDVLRRLQAHESLFTVTERELHGYRIMNLIDVAATRQFVDHVISTR